MAQAKGHIAALEASVRELELQLSAQEKELFHANQLLQQQPATTSAGASCKKKQSKIPFLLSCV